MRDARLILVVVLFALVYVPIAGSLTALAWLYFSHGSILHAVIVFAFAVLVLIILFDHVRYVRAKACQVRNTASNTNANFRA